MMVRLQPVHGFAAGTGPAGGRYGWVRMTR